MKIILTLFLLIGFGGAHADEYFHPRAGVDVFAKWCAPCHANTPTAPGTMALHAKYHDALPAALEQRSDLTPELIRYVVRNGDTVMPIFRKTEVSDAQLDALIGYLCKEK